MRGAGLHWQLPGQKLEGVAQDHLPLAPWFASLSTARGPVGIVVAEDMADAAPMVLYVQRGRLYVDSSKPEDAVAIDDGSLYLGGA